MIVMENRPLASCNFSPAKLTAALPKYIFYSKKLHLITIHTFKGIMKSFSSNIRSRKHLYKY